MVATDMNKERPHETDGQAGALETLSEGLTSREELSAARGTTELMPNPELIQVLISAHVDMHVEPRAARAGEGCVVSKSSTIRGYSKCIS